MLEINDTPSFNINLNKEGPTGLIKLPSEVDRFIKTTVVGDGIKLMRSKKFKPDRGLIDQHGCWKRILPQEHDESDN